MSETQQRAESEVEPACGSVLTGTGSYWIEEDPAIYPPGYPRLCQAPECFHDVDVREDGTAPDWDHREHVDVLVRSYGGAGTRRRVHRRGRS